MKNVLDVLTERGFVKQTVYGDDLRKKLETADEKIIHSVRGKGFMIK